MMIFNKNNAFIYTLIISYTFFSVCFIFNLFIEARLLMSLCFLVFILYNELFHKVSYIRRFPLVNLLLIFNIFSLKLMYEFGFYGFLIFFGLLFILINLKNNILNKYMFSVTFFIIILILHISELNAILISYILVFGFLFGQIATNFNFRYSLRFYFKIFKKLLMHAFFIKTATKAIETSGETAFKKFPKSSLAFGGGATFIGLNGLQREKNRHVLCLEEIRLREQLKFKENSPIYTKSEVLQVKHELDAVESKLRNDEYQTSVDIAVSHGLSLLKSYKFKHIIDF